MKFPGSYKDRLRDARAANEFNRQMYSPDSAPLEYPELSKPKRAAPVRDPERISEAQVNDMIRQFSASRDDIALWRNSRGIADLPNGGKLRFGVGPDGASDWLGYKRVEITPEMVGQTISVFCAVEAKAPDNLVVPDHQQAFIRSIHRAGGIAIVVRSREDLEQL